jgi:hypothetical protein
MRSQRQKRDEEISRAADVSLVEPRSGHRRRLLQAVPVQGPFAQEHFLEKAFLEPVLFGVESERPEIGLPFPHVGPRAVAERLIREPRAVAANLLRYALEDERGQLENGRRR